MRKECISCVLLHVNIILLKLLLGNLSQPQWFVLLEPVSDFSPLKFLKRKEERGASLLLAKYLPNFTSGWNTQHNILQGICTVLSHANFRFFSFFLLFLPKMQTKSCLYEKCIVSIFVGQTTVITLISCASTFLPFEKFKLFSIYSSQCGLQTFVPQNLIVI